MRRGLPALALVPTLTWFGCGQGTSKVQVESASPRAEATRERLEHLLNTDNGLLVRQWVVADDAERIGSALMRHRDGTVVNATRSDELQLSGLRLVRVPADVLDGLLGELGVTPLDVSAWHGQVLDWRELHHQPVTAGGGVVAVDGRVRSLEGGRLRLLARAWTVPMEDGPTLYLEMVPQLIRSHRTNIYEWLGGPAQETELFAGQLVQVQLEPGYAYVLTGEAPAAEWAPSGVTPAPAPVGPEAVTPDTLGEYLFSNHAEPAMRTLLVFVPRIPDRYLTGNSNLAAAD